eukprot:11165288-Lingulodinium_polyedra.AAC.1
MTTNELDMQYLAINEHTVSESICTTVYEPQSKGRYCYHAFVWSGFTPGGAGVWRSGSFFVQ